ncbi:MAG: DoxX family protein [Candidatus Pacebacteria bacterium]|nr:DoxX family protein [Candidatus Paceibacterota bacterium]
MDLLLLLGRILFGGFFLYSGIKHFTRADAMAGYAGSKHVPSPKVAVYVSGLLIFLGGAGVVLGISPEWSLAFIIIFLLPVTFIMHQFWKETDGTQRALQTTNFLKNIALLGAALMLLSVSTPWTFSF